MRKEFEKRKQDRDRSLRGREVILEREQAARIRRLAAKGLPQDGIAEDDFDNIIKEHKKKMKTECPVANVSSDVRIEVPQSSTTSEDDSSLVAITKQLRKDYDEWKEEQEEHERILEDVDALRCAARSVGSCEHDACQFIDASLLLDKPTRSAAQRKAGRRCTSRRRSKRVISSSHDVARDSARRALQQRRIEKNHRHSQQMGDRMLVALEEYKAGSLSKRDALAFGGLDGRTRRFLRDLMLLYDEHALDVERRCIIDDARALKRSAYDWMHPEVPGVISSTSARLYSLPGMYVLTNVCSILVKYTLLTNVLCTLFISHTLPQ